jgi:tetratricopeptide (TPR) repeat protein
MHPVPPPDHADDAHAPPAEPAARPTAWFLHRGTRVFGPLTRDETLGYFTAGMVVAGDTVTGPEWDGALTIAEAARRFESGALLPAVDANAMAPVTPGAPAPQPLPPLRGAPIAFRRAGPGWRVVAVTFVVLLVVQLKLVPAHSLGAHHDLGEFLFTVASRFLLTAVSCFAVVLGAGRLVLGRWPSARGPLVAMALVYAGLLGKRLADPEVPASPAIAATGDELPAIARSDAADIEEADPSLEWARRDRAERASADARERRERLEREVDERMRIAAQASTAPVAPAAPSQQPAARAPADSPAAIANRLYAANDWNGLLAYSTEWVRNAPDDAVAWRYLALANDRLRRYDASIPAFERVVELDADSPRARSNLGNAYLQADRFREAAVLFEQILARDPDDRQALTAYGYAMSNAGEYDEAVAALERAVKLYPDYRLAWENLGWAHRSAGYPDRAKDAFARADALP